MTHKLEIEEKTIEPLEITIRSYASDFPLNWDVDTYTEDKLVSRKHNPFRAVMDGINNEIQNDAKHHKNQI